MKKINFKKIIIKNFLSIGNEPLEIEFKDGLNIITGYNRDEDDIKNGVGKSLISDAIYFALFGTTLRDLSKNNFIVNRQTSKNCVVTLEVDVDSAVGREFYIIERKLAPSGLKIWKNSTEITKSTISETNEYIKKIFYLEEDIIQNCILMRSNNIIPFMNKKRPEKKRFIESIFNIEIFTSMLKAFKDDEKAWRNELLDEDKKILGFQNNISSYGRELDRLNEKKKEIIEFKEKKEVEITEKIKSELANKEKYKLEAQQLNFNQDSYKQNEKNKMVIVENIKKLDIALRQLAQDAAILENDLKKIEKSPSVCPTCGREFDNDFKKAQENNKLDLSQQLSEVKSKEIIIKNKKNEFETKLNGFNNSLEDFYKLKNEYDNLNFKISMCERQVENLKREFEINNRSIDLSGIESLQKLIDEANCGIIEVKKNKEAIERKLGKGSIVNMILEENGVKSFVINKLLEAFNSRINYYLQGFKSTFKFSFNNQFYAEIIDSKGLICEYSNCSGAEMKKIDLAISFALLDVLAVQRQVEYNILFFDEILDSSLDNKSLDTVLNFISEQIYNTKKAVYIISHKTDIQIPDIREVILLEKINGFTKRIEN